MTRRPLRPRRPRAAWLGAGVAAIAGLAGTGGCTRAADDRIELSAADFADDDAPLTITLDERASADSAGSAPVAAGSGAADAALAGRGGTDRVASGADLPLVATPGRPGPSAPGTGNGFAEASPADPLSPVGEVLVDAKLGDINGRPIYAESFLGPLSGRLSAEAAVRPPAAWAAFASRLIQDRMRLMVQDELLRAEALSRLSPEEKQGLRAFVSGLRDTLISQNYGSAALAESTLLEERGLTSSEFMERQESEILVNETLRREISGRVQVSWRDIRQRYERDADRYRPPPLARFRVLAVGRDDAEAVSAALDAGEPFAELAAGPLNRFNRDAGGVVEVELTDDGGAPELFGADAINELAVGLPPGAWAGPVEFGSRTYWVFLESVEDRTVELYDAQLEIERAIRSTRENAEIRRLFADLTGGPIERQLVQLHARLLAVAIERYGPEG